jgi:hypothetical protein
MQHTAEIRYCKERDATTSILQPIVVIERDVKVSRGFRYVRCLAALCRQQDHCRLDPKQGALAGTAPCRESGSQHP